MNRVELEEADAAAGRRMNASLPDNAMALSAERNSVVSVFAGTDLPGHDVLRLLGRQIDGHAPRVVEIGVTALCQGIALNAFMFGYECGKRS